MESQGRRLNILTQAEIDAFSAIPTLSDAERDHYFHLNDEEASMLSGRESAMAKALFILFFGYFKLRPMVVSPTVEEVRDDFRHICSTQFPGEDIELVMPSAMQKSRMYDKIFEACGTRRFTPDFRERLLIKALEHVRIDIDRRALFDALMTFVYFHEMEIPKYYVFQAIISEAIRAEESRISDVLASTTTPNIEQTIQDLLNDEHTQSTLNQVKKLPRTFSRSDFAPELLAFEKIQPAYADLQHVIQSLSISKGNVSQYASLVEHLSVTRLKQVGLDRRRICLVCYLHHRFQLINDNFFQAFVFLVRKVTADAKVFASKRILSERQAIEAKLGDAADVVDLFVDDTDGGDSPFSIVRQRVYNKISRQELAAVSQFMRTMSVDQKRFEWEYIDKHKRQDRRFLRQLFMALEFVDSTDSPSFMSLANTLYDDIVDHGDLQTIDRRSLTKAVRPYLVADTGHPISHRVEFYIYQGIQRRLEKCQWYVKNSSRHDPFEQDLVDPQDWERDKARYIEAVNLQVLATPPATLLQEKLSDLHSKLARVGAGVAQRENESIILTTKDGAPNWTVKRQPKEVEVNNPFFKKMRRIEVIDVIAMIARDTDFFQEIRHIKGTSTRQDDLGVFMACLIANATRFGTFKMSEICDYSYDVLRNFHGNYMRQETLHNAIDRIHNATAKLKIFQYYNIKENTVHASSDGQKFTARKNTLRTRYSTKYFGQGKGLSAYTMNANHMPLNGIMAGLNDHESHFAFDIMYNNTADVKPDVLSTDTHGVNRFNYALFDLSEWSFAPRYANLSGVIDKLFRVDTDGGSVSLALRKPINEKKIIEQWDFIQRIIVSLHQKETSQAALVRKMSRSAPNDKQLAGLAEYDRLVRAHYILDLMEDPALRKYVQRALNRGEAYHALQRAIEQINGDPNFRGESDREIDEWHACARLLASCIIHFNSAVLSALLNSYERQGKPELAELVKAVSPVAWLHINLSGNYSFNDINHHLDLMELVRSLTEALSELR